MFLVVVCAGSAYGAATEVIVACVGVAAVDMRTAGKIKLDAEAVPAGAVAQAGLQTALPEYAVHAVVMGARRVLLRRVFFHGVDELFRRLVAVGNENARFGASLAGTDDERHFLDELAFGLAVLRRLLIPENGGFDLLVDGGAVYKEQRKPFGGEERIIGRLEHDGDGLVCRRNHGAERECKHKREEKSGDFFHRGLLFVR